MPMSFTKRFTGGRIRGKVYVGPQDYTSPIDVVLSSLTAREIDANGYLKEGVPISEGGGLIGGATVSVPGAATPGPANVGNGVMGAATGKSAGPAETITVAITSEAANAGGFSVNGSVSGFIGNGTVGVAFTSAVVDFTLADGAVDFAIGDNFVWTVTAGVNNRLYGCIAEDMRVATDNAALTIAALPVRRCVVQTIGQVNRDILEDNLEAPLTDEEVTAFHLGRIVLI